MNTSLRELYLYAEKNKIEYIEGFTHNFHQLNGLEKLELKISNNNLHILPRFSNNTKLKELIIEAELNKIESIDEFA
jgi:hypothetical protein